MRAILTYHSIDPSGSPISIDEASFREHVAFLASGRVEVVALERILQVPPERDALALTFDDGFASLAEKAWPLLSRHRLPATLFVATARVGADNAWGGCEQRGIPTMPLLSWDALAALAAEGLAVGSHSRAHTRLTELSDADLEGELAGSADEIEKRLGRRPASLCYPYGAVDERVAAAAARHYALACTTELRALSDREDPCRLPRLDAFYYRSPERLAAFGSTSFRRHLWLRARARGLRQALSG